MLIQTLVQVAITLGASMMAHAIPAPQNTITGSSGGPGGGISTGAGGTVTGSQGGAGGNVGISTPPRNFYYPYYPAGYDPNTGVSRQVVPGRPNTITGSQGGAGGGVTTGTGGTVAGSQGGPGGGVQIAQNSGPGVTIGISSVDDWSTPPRNPYYPYYPAGFNQATGQRLNPQGSPGIATGQASPGRANTGTGTQVAGGGVGAGSGGTVAGSQAGTGGAISTAQVGSVQPVVWTPYPPGPVPPTYASGITTSPSGVASGTVTPFGATGFTASRGTTAFGTTA
ncbi:hypothetical protein SeMB42_g05125 [Synchytrium endobioticum]|uniref:Uncharacterized protein n=1 Tax=Synchytrium endobioticum TaxID=286115 RepID=A0A507CTD2_9FUNG|nr:hypothetical protein SeMB42_g05125 [Synchytrium endobioticum]TPX46072.1 hypothetical protein SeLEV6574_g03452 [Synchytrium endobioticum]